MGSYEDSIATLEQELSRIEETFRELSEDVRVLVLRDPESDAAQYANEPTAHERNGQPDNLRAPTQACE
jgi:hypothetical protein